eukprot:152763-Pelagomonas_calceolata.AAC.2
MLLGISALYEDPPPAKRRISFWSNSECYGEHELLGAAGDGAVGRCCPLISSLRNHHVQGANHMSKSASLGESCEKKNTKLRFCILG